ncbi:hypothetical protein E4U21_001815 [Claviceps maximensis]|nr:hypothetical protein E4U21_001815 [Claviceps maximensis]
MMLLVGKELVTEGQRQAGGIKQEACAGMMDQTTCFHHVISLESFRAIAVSTMQFLQRRLWTYEPTNNRWAMLSRPQHLHGPVIETNIDADSSHMEQWQKDEKL